MFGKHNHPATREAMRFRIREPAWAGLRRLQSAGDHLRDIRQPLADFAHRIALGASADNPAAQARTYKTKECSVGLADVMRGHPAARTSTRGIRVVAIQVFGWEVAVF
jgi:hypothetical protein